jgi:hypothetical protein
MLDLVAIASLVFMFGLALAYIRGCDRLKGTRP